MGKTALNNSFWGYDFILSHSCGRGLKFHTVDVQLCPHTWKMHFCVSEKKDSESKIAVGNFLPFFRTKNIFFVTKTTISVIIFLIDVLIQSSIK